MLPLHTLINQTYQIEIDLCLIALIHICSNWTNVNKCNVIIIQPQDLRGLAVAMFHFQARYSSEKLRPNRSIGGLFLAKNESRLTACCCSNFDRPNIAFLIYCLLGDLGFLSLGAGFSDEQSRWLMSVLCIHTGTREPASTWPHRRPTYLMSFRLGPRVCFDVIGGLRVRVELQSATRSTRSIKRVLGKRIRHRNTIFWGFLLNAEDFVKMREVGSWPWNAEGFRPMRKSRQVCKNCSSFPNA